MATTTQTTHPWRATARTIFAATVGLLSILPLVFATAGISQEAYAAQVLVVTGAVTRVLALPGVNAWLEKFVPWLAAAPKATADTTTAE